VGPSKAGGGLGAPRNPPQAGALQLQALQWLRWGKEAAAAAKVLTFGCAGADGDRTDGFWSLDLAAPRMGPTGLQGGKTNQYEPRVTQPHPVCPAAGMLLRLFPSHGHSLPRLPRAGLWALLHQMAKCNDALKKIRLQRCNP